MKPERKSQRIIYAENREKYFDEVVSLFAQGKTAREISQMLPIGKSTVHRWVNEYNARKGNITTDLLLVRQSPQTAVRQLIAMEQRIAELEARNDGSFVNRERELPRQELLEELKLISEISKRLNERIEAIMVKLSQ